MKHSERDWSLILAAYIYECTEEQAGLMSDKTYDIVSRLAEGSTQIPGFNPNTGQWIHDLIKNKAYRDVIEAGYRSWQGYAETGHGEGLTAHILIPKEYIIETYGYEKFSDYKLLNNIA